MKTAWRLFPDTPGRISALCWWTAGLAGLGFAVAALDAAPAAGAIVTHAAEPGLHSTTFTTPQGVVRVYLPDDLAAGDMISGTVVAEPAGNNEAERARNREVLGRDVVHLAGTLIVPVAQGRFTLRVPPTLAAPVLDLVLAPAGQTARPLA